MATASLVFSDSTLVMSTLSWEETRGILLELESLYRLKLGLGLISSKQTGLKILKFCSVRVIGW